LKQARENMDITIEEVAEDLKLEPSQLEYVEKGDRTIFKDVFTLKQTIKDYAKYLGLEYEKIENEFNEFVFEYTSKIPVVAIAKANKEIKKEEKKLSDIKSPYTQEKNDNSFLIKILYVLIFIFLIVVGYFTYKIIQININDININNNISFFNY